MSEWTAPLTAQWPQWVKIWEREGHFPEDLERVSKLVREGEISETEGRAIIQEANTDTLDYLAARSVITDAEYKVIVTAFLRIDVDAPLGEPEIIQTLGSKTHTPRRMYVLAQEFRGIAEPRVDRELVLSDPISKRKLATLTFYFEGYRNLVVEHLFVVKTEWTERYSELLFSEILGRYPSIQTVAFEVPNFDVQDLRKRFGKQAQPTTLIRASRAYQVASAFGFGDFKFLWQRATEGTLNARIFATRALPSDRR